MNRSGLGRAVIATIVLTTVVALSAGCSSASADGSTGSTSKAFQVEFLARGFSNVAPIGDFTEGAGYLFNLSAGKCRGTASAYGSDLSARFTGSDGKQYLFNNPTAILVGLSPKFEYCKISTSTSTSNPTPTATTPK